VLPVFDVGALPVFHNTVLGDAFYVTVLFGGLALAEKRCQCYGKASSPRQVRSG
jgi:hypothetical protein